VPLLPVPTAPAALPPAPIFSSEYIQPVAVAATSNNPSLDTPRIDAAVIDGSLD
jgi:hypothetical protein